jgi:uncharacterized protein DUF1559
MTSPTTTPPKPFQFTLRHLATWIVLLSLCLALIVQLQGLGLIIAIGAMGVAAMYWGNGRDSRATLSLGVCLFLLAGWLLLVIAASESRPAARRASCQNNLKQIGLALHCYHDVYGSFPPAYIADASGKPIHSWRVLILPFLEQQALYEAYSFDEPWDGPNNSKLAAKMPRVFECPSEIRHSPPIFETSYVAVVGANTVWPGENSVSMKQVHNGLPYTLLVAEAHESGIHWMEPRDLHMVQMPLAVNAIRGQGIGSVHGTSDDRGRGNCAQVLLCDGSVRTLKNDIPPATLRALLTIAGGETVGDY